MYSHHGYNSWQTYTIAMTDATGKSGSLPMPKLCVEALLSLESMGTIKYHIIPDGTYILSTQVVEA